MLKKCHLVSLCFFLISIPIVGCTLEPLSRVGSVNCEGAKSITTIIDGKEETFQCAALDDDGECSIYEVGDKRVKPRDFHNEEWTYWANSLGNEKCPDGFRCKSDRDSARCELMKCDGKEVDFFTSNQHCGRCGNRCPEDAPLCKDGKCSVFCDGIAVDPQRNDDYCGAKGDCLGNHAGKKCIKELGEYCEAGKCELGAMIGMVNCGDEYIDPDNDPMYCGAKDDCRDERAGKKCESGEVCSRGKCSTSCLSGFVLCDNRCVAPATDNAFCGASGDCSGANAGERCKDGEVCSGSKCGVTCVSGQILCNGQCIDPESDNRYCGASDNCKDASVGMKCESGEVCSGGKCSTSCLSGYVLCSNRCVDPLSDNAYCGASGDCSGANAGERCESGKVCSAGSCGTSCLSGQILCNGQCIDPESDNRYCGATADCTGPNAGEKCASGEVCSAGTCGASCLSGQILCNGQCIDPDTDNRYCGATDDCLGTNVGEKCDSGKVCSGGTCGASCLSGQILCNGQCIDPDTDNRYCGAKDNCSGANAGSKCKDGEVCSAGKCGVTCVSGQILCNGQCIDPTSDNRYCGAQDGCIGATKCKDGEVCSAGKCGVTCVSGQILCNGQCVDPKTDNRYCGAKDNCSGANAGKKCGSGQVCSGGVCGVTCVSGQLLCNGQCIDPETDNRYCGAKDDCSGANAGKQCASGQVCSGSKCGVTCVSGQILCNGQCIDPYTDNRYCGAKGRCNSASVSDANYRGQSCTSGQVCSGGKCGVTCVAGQIVCGGRCVDPSSDNSYCGSKGKCNSASASDANYRGAICAEGTKCTGGVCKISCVSGQIACDGECIDPKTNPYYCGATGNCEGSNRGTDCTKSPTNKLCAGTTCTSSCPTGQTQCAGYCIDMNATNVLLCDGNKIKCKDGYGNCDNDVANGCEANTISDNAHCGICGNACTTGNVENSQSVQCTKDGCKATSCVRGYVLKDGECHLSNSLDCCGAECKNCYKEHPNMKEGYCMSILARCDINSCKDGYTYDSTKKKCVEMACFTDDDCGNSGYCIEGKCKCDEISACSGTRPICYQKKCVECTRLEHCPSIANATQQCKENECVHRCSAGYHMDKYSKCLENSDSACGSPEIFSAVPCSENTPKCNKYTGLCVECINADNCILPENGKRKWCNSDNKCDILCNEGFLVVSLGGQKKCMKRPDPIVPEPGPGPEPWQP